MAKTGGRTPYDKAGAHSGPARVLWAPTTVAVPSDINDIVPMVADVNGEYGAKTGWVDFGLSADAPSYTHDKDTDGLSYQQAASDLFQVVSDISRSFTAQVAELDKDNMKIMENANRIVAVTAAAGKSAQDKVPIGLYQTLKLYRIAMISYRPEGAASVVEPAPSTVGTRPPIVALVLPQCALAANGTDVEVSRGDPTNMEIEFTAFPEPTLTLPGEEHGFWLFERAGTIT